MDEQTGIGVANLPHLDERVPGELGEYGRRVWVKLVADLKRSSFLRQADREPFTRYCDILGRYWKMSETIEREGETVKVPTIAKNAAGEPGVMIRRHPLLAELRASASELRHIEDRLGMNPAARASLLASVLRRRADDGLFGGGTQTDDVPGAAPENPENADPGQFH